MGSYSERREAKKGSGQGVPAAGETQWPSQDATFLEEGKQQVWYPSGHCLTLQTEDGGGALGTGPCASTARPGSRSGQQSPGIPSAAGIKQQRCR